jgi:hypothetical protein
VKVTLRDYIRVYRHDRAMTKGLMPWRLFIRAWVASWRIAHSTGSPEEARSEGSAWGWKHRVHR